MSRFVDDSAELARRLEDSMEAVLNRYWPDWVRTRVKSQDIALLTPRVKTDGKGKKSKRPTSSFTLNLSGDRRGQWYRFSQGVGGGMLALLFYGKNGSVPSSKADWAEAYKLAREFLGISQQRDETLEERSARESREEKDRKDREERDRREADKRLKRDARRTYSAQEVWNEAKSLAGSQGEAYLTGRGIPPVASWPWDCSNTIRFHPSLDYELDSELGRYPAIVAAVQDPFGQLIAVWQIFLDRKNAVKAPIDNPKVGRGPAAGGAVRVGGEADRIGACEGLETGLGLWALEGFRMPIWPMLSTSGMMGFEPPIFVKRLSIYHDGDKGLLQNGRLLKPPGQNAADVLSDRMSAIGVGTNRNEMPILGDGLDLLQTRNEIERTKHAGRIGERRG